MAIDPSGSKTMAPERIAPFETAKGILGAAEK